MKEIFKFYYKPGAEPRQKRIKLQKVKIFSCVACDGGYLNRS